MPASASDRHDLAETLDLALGLKIDRDGCVFVAPLLQPGDELRALRFCEHEIADGEFADVAIDKCAGKIFRAPRHRFRSSFANLNVAWREARPAAASPTSQELRPPMRARVRSPGHPE